jgi:hypothetical protein
MWHLNWSLVFLTLNFCSSWDIEWGKIRNEGTQMKQSARVAYRNRDLCEKHSWALRYCFVPVSTLAMYLLKLDRCWILGIFLYALFRAVRQIISKKEIPNEYDLTENCTLLSFLKLSCRKMLFLRVFCTQYLNSVSWIKEYLVNQYEQLSAIYILIISVYVQSTNLGLIRHILG